MRWLVYIAVALFLCSCASRKHTERSVEQTTTYNDSSMMASQFVLDSVWRDSSTIVQTVVEFYEPNEPSDTAQAIKRIVRTEIQRNVSASKQTIKTDTIVSVSSVDTEKSEKVLENSEKSSTFTTHTITIWFWLIGIILILVIGFILVFIRLIRR